MELRQLRYLVALAQDLSFTTAATRAKVAQPALSRQIRKLEEELGTTLVDRTSRRVTMTGAGQQLVERARLILDAVEEAYAEVAEVTQLETGLLAIGATQTPGPLDIARLLHKFHTLHPGIELTVREELSVTIAERLRRDEIELGLVAEIPQTARHGLELRQIAAEPLVIALPPEHRLAAATAIDFHDLENEVFVTFPEGATIRSTLDQLATGHGVTPNIGFVTSDTNRMLELVGLGLGISLLPQSDASRPDQRHTTIEIRDPQLTYNVYLARRLNRRKSPAVIAMTSLVLM